MHNLIDSLLGFAWLDLLHTFSYLPRDFNFIDHTSNIGWKEYVNITSSFALVYVFLFFFLFPFVGFKSCLIDFVIFLCIGTNGQNRSL